MNPALEFLPLPPAGPRIRWIERERAAEQAERSLMAKTPA